MVVWDSNEVWGHQSVVASVHSVAQFFFFFNSPSVQQQRSDDNTDEADLCVYPGQFSQSDLGTFHVGMEGDENTSLIKKFCKVGYLDSKQREGSGVCT